MKLVPTKVGTKYAVCDREISSPAVNEINIKSVMENKVSATIFIIVHPNGTILMQKRDDGRGKKISYPNKWCFPGGTKKTDEDYLSCAVREAMEEYNLVLRKENCRLIHVYDYDGKENNHVFLCWIDSSQEPELREGAGMKWMKIDEVKKLGLDLAVVQNEIIPKLEKNLKEKNKEI